MLHLTAHLKVAIKFISRRQRRSHWNCVSHFLFGLFWMGLLSVIWCDCRGALGCCYRQCVNENSITWRVSVFIHVNELWWHVKANGSHTRTLHASDPEVVWLICHTVLCMRGISCLTLVYLKTSAEHLPPSSVYIFCLWWNPTQDYFGCAIENVI